MSAPRMFNNIAVLAALLAFALAAPHSTPAHADTITSAIPDTSSIISAETANAIVKTFGLSMDHRSYEPATPLGTVPGIDISLEVTLAKPPAALGTALTSISAAQSGETSSSSSSTDTVPILPSVKLHLHKGFGRVDIGVSALPPVATLPIIGGSYMVGGDIKVVVFNPEEGPVWAVRASYNLNSIVFKSGSTALKVATNTIVPQVLVSKKLEFADPYLGVGLPYTWGSMSVELTLPEQAPPAPSLSSITIAQSGKGYALTAFGGLSLRVPRTGLRVTVEGAYNTAGVDYLGTKIGFTF